MSGFWWRRVHRLASGLVLVLGVVHLAVTPLVYRTWSPDTVWFVGTGLGVLLLAALNVAHVGTEPCRLPTARLVRVANWVFVIFGIGALVAVPQPQALALWIGLAGQAVAAQRTLPGPATESASASGE